MAVSSYGSFQMTCSVQKPASIFPSFKTTTTSSLPPSSFKPLMKKLQKVATKFNLLGAVKTSSGRLVEAFVDLVFKFVDQPLLPSQTNFAPVEESPHAILVNDVQGTIPADFPDGVYIRNGPNPPFGGLKSTKSVFGASSQTWFEGEGMLHSIRFEKDKDGKCKVFYNNRYVETDTIKMEKERKKPSFLPAIEGDSPAVLSAYLLNFLRFGKVNKDISNTNIFEHSGKYYSIAENHSPQEIDIFTLQTLGYWDIDGAWTRPFTSHPKKAPGTGELVIMGVDAKKPFLEVGIVSADGEKLVHKADLKFDRATLCHDIGVTSRFNVILDFPLTIDIDRLVKGGPLIKYDKEGYARIGVMPRYGDADSVKWFDVSPCTAFHIFNSFEDGDEVVVRACKARGSVIPGPDLGLNKFEWFSRGFDFEPLSSDEEIDDSSEHEGLLFSRACEWRLNLQTGEVRERNLTGKDSGSMDFPMINEYFMGIETKYGYTQVLNSAASSISGMTKFGGLAKLYFEEREPRGFVKLEHHKFPKKTFCTGSAFVPKQGGDEDDGWIITFVHNEDRGKSYVYIVDTKKFCSEPVAIISLPSRVPYGFHGAFMPSETLRQTEDTISLIL